MTLLARCKREPEFESLYAANPFVSVVNRFPSVKEVEGSNRCVIGWGQQAGETVVTCVIDNLLKGAAGGGVQWLNRMCGFPDSLGLEHDAVGWA